jgi:hypothetical protein
VLRVLRQRDFAVLWLTGLISIIGDWMLFIALPITVYQLTESPVAASGVVISNRLPSLFLGSFTGVYVDRRDRRYQGESLPKPTPEYASLRTAKRMVNQRWRWTWSCVVGARIGSSVKGTLRSC